MGWYCNRQIKLLQSQLHETELRLAASEERLAAERAINADYDLALDESMEMAMRLLDDNLALEAKLDAKTAMLMELKHKLTGTHRELCDLDPELLAIWERGKMHAVREAGD